MVKHQKELYGQQLPLTVLKRRENNQNRKGGKNIGKEEMK